MPTMKVPDLATFKAWAKDCAPAARAVCMARAFAEVERERVDAYIAPIFAAYRFEYRPGRSGLTGVIPDPKYLYMVEDLDDPLVAAFYADCAAAHRAHGWTGPADHCPALHAETLRRETERLLIGLAEPLFGLSNDHLFGDNRVKYLELLIGACLSAPHADARAATRTEGQHA